MRQKLFAGRLSNKTANIIDNYENHKINVQDTLPAHPAGSGFLSPRPMSSIAEHKPRMIRIPRIPPRIG